MRDAAAENRAFGIIFVEMKRIQVAADGAELRDVRFGDGTRVARKLANRQIFDAIAGDAWSAVHERFPHALNCLIGHNSYGQVNVHQESMCITAKAATPLVLKSVARAPGARPSALPWIPPAMKSTSNPKRLAPSTSVSS